MDRAIVFAKAIQAPIGISHRAFGNLAVAPQNLPGLDVLATKALLRARAKHMLAHAHHIAVMVAQVVAGVDLFDDELIIRPLDLDDVVAIGSTDRDMHQRTMDDWRTDD